MTGRFSRWAGLLLSVWLAQTIVCQVPDFDVVVGPPGGYDYYYDDYYYGDYYYEDYYYDPGYVVVDEYWVDDGYYYDDCCWDGGGDFWFDWWW